MSALDHPFRFPYLGLGLLDESSIQRNGETWTAVYSIGDEPYLKIRIAPDLVEIDEIEHGTSASWTVDLTLEAAIARHGQSVLAGNRSRFWRRVADHAHRAWVQLPSPGIPIEAWVPAIGLGILCLPTPLDKAWDAPAPGPIARRLGFHPFAEGNRVAPASAQLRRYVAGEPEPRVESIQLHQAVVPAILVPETVDAIFDAAGHSRSIEWRPFLIQASCTERWVGARWYAPTPTLLPDGGLLEKFEIALVEGSGGTAAEPPPGRKR